MDAVIQLSLQYGIITPYTSFLIEEEELFYSEGWDEAAENLLEAYSGEASGADAVGKADAESSLRAAESVPQVDLATEDAGEGSLEKVLKAVGEKTFVRQDGVWMDSLYESDKMELVLIEFGSDTYYAFLEARPDWGKFFALGDEVIFTEGEDAYRITTAPGGVVGLPEDFDPGNTDPTGEIPEESTPVSDWRSLCSLPWLTGLALFGWAWRR